MDVAKGKSILTIFKLSSWKSSSRVNLFRKSTTSNVDQPQAMGDFIILLMTNMKQYTTQKMKFPIKNFFSKSDQIRIWTHLLKKFLMESFIFCAVVVELSLDKVWQKIVYINCSFVGNIYKFLYIIVVLILSSQLRKIIKN